MAAAIVLLAQSLVSGGLDFDSNDLSQLALGILLVGLLLWGSRVAWVILFLGALHQIVSSVYSGQWRIATGIAIAACLIAPASLRYVWQTPVEQKSGWMGHRIFELYLKVRNPVYSIARRMAGWDGDENHEYVPLLQRSYYVGLWRFGISCVVLFALAGAFGLWNESTESSILPVRIIAGFTWICYLVTQLSFILLVVLAMWSAVVRHRPRGSATRDQ